MLKGSTIKCYLWQKFHVQCYICSNLILNHTMNLIPSTDDFFIFLPVVSRLQRHQQPTTTTTTTTTTNNKNNNPSNREQSMIISKSKQISICSGFFLYRTSLVFVKSSVRDQEGNVTKHFEKLRTMK